jgi:hypothetical protein
MDDDATASKLLGPSLGGRIANRFSGVNRKEAQEFRNSGMREN